ncbi:Glucokinase [compost metagenome]
MNRVLEYAIGIDLGGTNIKAGIVTSEGGVVYRISVPTNAHKGGEAILEHLAAIVEKLRLYASEQDWEIQGVGIGSAGQVNAEAGIVMGATANLPGWAGMRLRERLNALTGLPVVIDNDANAMAYGEAWIGSGRNWRDFICVTLGTGVGGCLIIDKQPYRGRDGFAGEIGHQVIQADGHPCNCGRAGCWEQYASVTALMRIVQESGVDCTKYHNPEEVFALAREGDLQAVELVDRYSSYIAIGLVNLIHLFNPQGIVIGGAVTKQGDFLLKRVRQQVYGQLLPVFRELPAESKIDIVPAALEDDGGVVGAVASYFLKKRL